MPTAASPPELTKPGNASPRIATGRVCATPLSVALLRPTVVAMAMMPASSTAVTTPPTISQPWVPNPSPRAVRFLVDVMSFSSGT